MKTVSSENMQNCIKISQTLNDKREKHHETYRKLKTRYDFIQHDVTCNQDEKDILANFKKYRLNLKAIENWK